MWSRTLLLLALVLVAHASPVNAGRIFRITSTDGKKTVTYDVKFGGGKSTGQLTAFCHKQQKFVYLT